MSNFTTLSLDSLASVSGGADDGAPATTAPAPKPPKTEPSSQVGAILDGCKAGAKIGRPFGPVGVGVGCAIGGILNPTPAY